MAELYSSVVSTVLIFELFPLFMLIVAGIVFVLLAVIHRQDRGEGH